MFHGYSQSGPSVDCRRHHRLRDRRRHHRRRRHDHGLRGNHRLDDGLLDNRLLHNDRLLHHHGLLHDRRRRVPRRIVGVAGGVIPDVVVPAAAVMGMDEATPPADKARRTGAAVEARLVRVIRFRISRVAGQFPLKRHPMQEGILPGLRTVTSSCSSTSKIEGLWTMVPFFSRYLLLLTTRAAELSKTADSIPNRCWIS